MTGSERWTAMTRSGQEVELQFNGVTEKIGVSSLDQEVVYFVAPERYRGDQRFSYNQLLTFDLMIGEGAPQASVQDIVIEGSGQSIQLHIFAQVGSPSVMTRNSNLSFYQ